LNRFSGRSKRIQHQPLARRLDARRCNHWVPSLARLPARMFETPYPEARCHIADLDFQLWVVRISLQTSSRRTTGLPWGVWR
jgi:hypothetical protein